jgi:hypothetical protein
MRLKEMGGGGGGYSQKTLEISSFVEACYTKQDDRKTAKRKQK